MGNCTERIDTNIIHNIVYSIPVSEPKKGESSIYRNPLAVGKDLRDFK